MNELWALPFEMAERVLSELASAKAVSQASIGGEAGENGSRYELVGGVAVIPVSGPIVREQGWYGTGQDAVASTLKAALADPSVRAILFDVNSPGGVVAGTKELADAIAEARTKKRCAAYANGLCASAAYWLAASTGTVYAPLTATVGSIGVIMTITSYAKLEEKWGISTMSMSPRVGFPARRRQSRASSVKVKPRSSSAPGAGVLTTRPKEVRSTSESAAAARNFSPSSCPMLTRNPGTDSLFREDMASSTCARKASRLTCSRMARSASSGIPCRTARDRISAARAASSGTTGSCTASGAVTGSGSEAERFFGTGGVATGSGVVWEGSVFGMVASGLHC